MDRAAKVWAELFEFERRHLWADFESEELENSLGRKAGKSGVRESESPGVRGVRDSQETVGSG